MLEHLKYGHLRTAGGRKSDLTCPVCVRYVRRDHGRSTYRNGTPREPNIIQADILVFHRKASATYKYAVNFIHLDTKLVYTHLLRKKTKSELQQAVDSAFRYIGVPTIIKADADFTSIDVPTYVSIVINAPYRSYSNGHVERYNRTQRLMSAKMMTTYHVPSKFFPICHTP
mmetsp:Transcript_595/g.933  ORF Transcript_595/g.933 Transcript_595/m.933 type:complete len:171 (-) Transcript_595:19-531(-)